MKIDALIQNFDICVERFKTAIKRKKQARQPIVLKTFVTHVQESERCPGGCLKKYPDGTLHFISNTWYQ